MLLVDETIAVNADLGEAYKWISNHENYKRWYPGVASVEALDGLPHGTAGKAYRERLDVGRAQPVEMTIRVVETVSSKRFVTESELGRWLTCMEVDLAPSPGGGTDVRWRFRLRNRFSLAKLAFRFAAAPRLRRRSRQGLSNLKRLIETERPH